MLIEFIWSLTQNSAIEIRVPEWQSEELTTPFFRNLK